MSKFLGSMLLLMAFGFSTAHALTCESYVPQVFNENRMSALGRIIQDYNEDVLDGEDVKVDVKLQQRRLVTLAKTIMYPALKNTDNSKGVTHRLKKAVGEFRRILAEDKTAGVNDIEKSLDQYLVRLEDSSEWCPQDKEAAAAQRDHDKITAKRESAHSREMDKLDRESRRNEDRAETRRQKNKDEADELVYETNRALRKAKEAARRQHDEEEREYDDEDDDYYRESSNRNYVR